MITFRLELDPEGNPKRTPSILNAEGKHVGVCQTATDSIRFEICQGSQFQVAESSKGQGAILAAILEDWAQARLDRDPNIRLHFAEDEPGDPITGVAFATPDGSGGFKTRKEGTARRLGFIVGPAEAADVIRLLKAGIAENRAKASISGPVGAAKLHIHRKRQSGANPAQCIARHPFAPQPELGQ